MNRRQARTILWALGSPNSEQNRGEAVSAVLDLLLDPERMNAKELAEKDREIERLTGLTDEMRRLWERVERAVGMDFAQTSAVVDRVVYLAESHPILIDQVKDGTEQLRLLIGQRDELMRSATTLLGRLNNREDAHAAMTELTELLDRTRREMSAKKS